MLRNNTRNKPISENFPKGRIEIEIEWSMYKQYSNSWQANRNGEASLIPDYSREIQRNSTFKVRYSGTKLKRDGHVGMSLVPADCNHLLARYTYILNSHWYTRLYGVTNYTSLFLQMLAKSWVSSVKNEPERVKDI